MIHIDKTVFTAVEAARDDGKYVVAVDFIAALRLAGLTVMEVVGLENGASVEFYAKDETRTRERSIAERVYINCERTR